MAQDLPSPTNSLGSSTMDEFFGVTNLREIGEALEIEQGEETVIKTVTPTQIVENRYVPRRQPLLECSHKKKLNKNRNYVSYSGKNIVAPEKSIVSYDEFLNGAQDTCDDLQFVNDDYIQIQMNGRNLLLEQDRTLGKGGHLWHGSYVLIESLLAEKRKFGRVLDLGAGGGFCTLALSASSVVLTDGDYRLLPLAKRNIQRNASEDTKFSVAHLVWTPDNDTKNEILDHEEYWSPPATNSQVYKELEYLSDTERFDLIIAAECVAPLYNPFSLLDTIRRYSIPGQTEIRLAVKHARFPIHCEAFYDRMRRYFDVEIVSPAHYSRLRAADRYHIIKARYRAFSSYSDQ